MNITQAFELPSREEITALGFVIKLEDASAQAKERLIRDYVLTPQLRLELPKIFRHMQSVYHQRGDMGRFIHGSFGSGKSHFMSVLGLLCENDASAWAKDDPLIQSLAQDHRPWLKEAKLLVVRLHMLSTAKKGTGFDRAMYMAFNQALRRHQGEEFVYVNAQAVIEEARKEAARYGDLFWTRMRDARVVESAQHFEELASGRGERREKLARAYLEFTGRDPQGDSLDLSWGEGVQRMAAHAKAHGFGGLVFLVDEFLLWLGEKNRSAFVEAINQLNTLVDHNTGTRAVPVYAFIARQRNIREFFPDMGQDDELHRHLDHHSKRFELTTLQDVELRHIVRERVLRRRHPQEVQHTVDLLAERHRKLLQTLMRDVEDGPGYLKDVYPFHPALIEMLIDISSLMQRERSALRLLYELLVIHHPDLPLGEFLPVGSAFEAIFPEAGVEGSKRMEDLKSVHRLYYTQFRPALAQLARSPAEGGISLPPARQKVLDQLIKTALLAEVSPRLKGTSGLDVLRLVQLNDADVVGQTERGKVMSAYQDLVELSRRVQGELQLSGQNGQAVVGIVLQGVNFGEILARARAKVDNPSSRFKTFYSVLKDELGLTGKPGFTEGSAEGLVEVRWRGTKRRGSVALKNVRDLSNAQFKVREGEEFRILVDYPWDEPGFTVDDDQKRAHDVRRRDGEACTVCWLPRHLSQHELEAVTNLSAARYLLTPVGQDELLRTLNASDRQRVLEQATSQAHTEESQLRHKLTEIYKDHGRAIPLISDVGQSVPETELKKNLEHFAFSLLDRRYPTHPEFQLEPTPEALKKLCAWMVEAGESPNQMGGFDAELGEILRKIAHPLELADPPGQSRARLRLDTRYIKGVLARADGTTVMWEALDTELESAHGLQPVVRNLFLAWLLAARGYRARNAVSGEVVSVPIDAKPRTGLRLERAEVLDMARWSQVRELGPALFKLEKASSHRSLAEQDRYAAELQRAGLERKSVVQKLHAHLARLAPGPALDGRRADLRVVLERLGPLTGPYPDAFTRLQALLSCWPEEASDPLRALLRSAEVQLEAVTRVNEHARSLLMRRAPHALHGIECQALLSELSELLGAREEAAALTPAKIDAWNALALALTEKLVDSPPPVLRSESGKPESGRSESGKPESGNLPIETVGVSSAPPGIPVFSGHPVSLRDGDALGQFMGALRRALQALGHDQVEVDVVVRVK